MRATPETTNKSRFHALIDEVFGPISLAPGSARRRLLLARSVLAYVGVISTLVQVVVWAMIGVITADLDTPWWLWTTIPAAAGVGVLTLVDRWRGWFVAASRTDETTEVAR